MSMGKHRPTARRRFDDSFDHADDVGGLANASAAAADIALPPPPTPKVRFAGVEKHPGHVFYVKFITNGQGRKGKPAPDVVVRAEVKDDNAMLLTGTQFTARDMFLLAMPRAEFTRLKSKNSSLEWLAEKAPGVLAASIPSPPLPIDFFKKVESPLTTYNVAIIDGKLTAEMVKAPKTSSELTLTARFGPGSSGWPACAPWPASASGSPDVGRASADIFQVFSRLAAVRRTASDCLAAKRGSANRG